MSVRRDRMLEISTIHPVLCDCDEGDQDFYSKRGDARDRESGELKYG